MVRTVIHFRAETKPLEHRSALTPTTTKALLEAGYIVRVERSSLRIFKDAEFEAVGATLVPEGSWVDAPNDHIIIGLKELPDENFPLRHTHIQFAHCYKQQDGWKTKLSRFARGGGTLYDLEFLQDASGRRLAAFGYYAGYAGAAIALLAWAHQKLHPSSTALPPLSSFDNEAALVAAVRSTMASAFAKDATAAAVDQQEQQHPRVIVIGALGRCGSGAVDLCLAVGIPATNLLKWDMAETAHGGPFAEIAESDVFINCIYLTQRIPPFVTPESLAKPGRRLSVACDVSCDPDNPNNPMPIYHEYSTFDRPTLAVPVEGDGPPLSIISIDHLPSLLPREASETFSGHLLPSLLMLDKRREEGPWPGAEKLFKEKVKELQDGI